MAISVSERMTNTLVQTKTIVVADIETTGFGGNTYDDITQISACIADLETGKVKKQKFNVYCKLRNRKKVPPDITQLTGITDELLQEKGMPVESALRQFLDYAGSLPILFHNYVFDWKKFLSPEFTRIGCKPGNIVICSLLISRFLLKGAENEPEGFNLETLVSYFGGNMENAHDASFDCLYTAGVVYHLRQLALTNGQAAIAMSEPESPEMMFNLDNMLIKSVRYWNKYNKERIYVTCTAGKIYYDIQQKMWQSTELFNGSIDWEQFESIILRYAQVDDMLHLIEKCKGAQIQKESLAPKREEQNPAPAKTPSKNLPVVTIYANSVFSEVTGKGGWGSLLIYGGEQKELHGTVSGATEEVVNLTALLSTLEAIKKPCLIQINMDARSIIDPLRQGWVFMWKKNGWRKASKKPVENVELWESLLSAIAPHEFTCCNLKGDVSDTYTKRCAQLAATAV